MLVIAKGAKGQEYLYSAASAHKVAQNERTAQKICDVLNGYKYKIGESEIWHIYEIDKYDTAYIYALDKRFTYGKNGIVKEIRY